MAIVYVSHGWFGLAFYFTTNVRNSLQSFKIKEIVPLKLLGRFQMVFTSFWNKIEKTCLYIVFCCFFSGLLYIHIYFLPQPYQERNLTCHENETKKIVDNIRDEVWWEGIPFRNKKIINGLLLHWTEYLKDIWSISWVGTLFVPSNKINFSPAIGFGLANLLDTTTYSLHVKTLLIRPTNRKHLLHDVIKTHLTHFIYGCMASDMIKNHLDS